MGRYCCSCSASGRCISCSCVKAGKKCRNCTPGRNFSCGNRQPGTLSSSQPSYTSIGECSNEVLPSSLPSTARINTTTEAEPNPRGVPSADSQCSAPAITGNVFQSSCRNDTAESESESDEFDSNTAGSSTTRTIRTTRTARSTAAIGAVIRDARIAAESVIAASPDIHENRSHLSIASQTPGTQRQDRRPAETCDQSQTLLESQTLEGDTDAELLASLADSQALAHSVVGAQDEGLALRDAELLASLAESQPTEHLVVGDQEGNITPLAAPAHAPMNNNAMPNHDVITPGDDTHTSKAIFDETVHWRKRFIKLPTGTAGKEFVSLMTTQIRRFLQSDGTSSEAMYNLSLLPVLLLQLPSSDSTPQANASHLLRRIALWNSGAMESLLTEGRCLQEVLFRTTRRGRTKGESDPAREFGDRIRQGKVNDALRLLIPNNDNRGVLKIDDLIDIPGQAPTTVQHLLQEKHPNGQPASPDVLLVGDNPVPHQIMFASLTPGLLRSVANHAGGSAGPSGLDSAYWRRMCHTYKGASTQLCEAMAELARLLATRILSPEALVPFVACRLVALDKNPGVRPIGVGEVLRRIIAKAILRIVSPKIVEACGPLQKCSGSPAGIEAAVHAMQQMFEDDATEGILLVDAKNAFNNLNREAALHNAAHLCPALATILNNSYQSSSRLFVVGGGELTSCEGTTQGDPLAMAFYALATVPLINHLQHGFDEVRQVWYADDSAGAGRLRRLLEWWNDLQAMGAAYGYHTNAAKTLLLVKTENMDEASQLFDGTGIRVVTGCAKYLGSFIGEPGPVEECVKTRVADWVEEIHQLATFAETEPHAALASVTHGLRGRWNYLLRTVPFSPGNIEALDTAITTKLLPALTGWGEQPSGLVDLLRLPARLGGIALPSFLQLGLSELLNSREVVKHQVQNILHQNVVDWLPLTAKEIQEEAMSARKVAYQQRRRHEAARCQEIVERSGSELSRRLEQLTAKGASSWLTAMPISEHGLHLSKRDFRDALALRYGWQLRDMPGRCTCGQEFTPTHAMCCAKGGFPTIRHNEVRDMVADLITEVCPNVAVEPLLAPITGERFKAASTNTAPDARADIRARGFWSRAETAFFDIRVFHPDAASYRHQPIRSVLEQQERRKRLEYAERIIHVDRGSFTPLVFTTVGGAAPECSMFLKRLCTLLAEKGDKSYGEVMSYVRCRLSFALLRSAIMCIRGSRSAYHRPVNTLRDVALIESRI